MTLDYQPKKLTIIHEPNDLLHKKAMKVEKFDDNLRNFAQDMIKTMGKDAGLASIQVQDDSRFSFDSVPEGYRPQPSVVVVFINQKNPPIIAINAEIVDKSAETKESFEGCLSIPNFPLKVLRHTWLKVRFQDLNGTVHETVYSEQDKTFEHIAFAHEIDHLNGITLMTKAQATMNNMQKSLLWKKFEQALSRAKIR